MNRLSNRLSNRRTLRGPREEARPPVFGPRTGGPLAALAEQASYWLLYVVALSAALLHWNAGNTGLAVLCGLAAAVAVRAIVRSFSGGYSGRARDGGGPEQSSV